MSFANYVPKHHLISGVTNAVKAEVTTLEPHGYKTSDSVRVFVPKIYGMGIDYAQTKIEVTGTNSFFTDIDTSNDYPFVSPTFSVNGQAFTQAQVTPINCGPEDNLEPNST